MKNTLTIAINRLVDFLNSIRCRIGKHYYPRYGVQICYRCQHLKMSQRYLLVNNPKTSVGDRTKLMKAIHSSLSETTTRLQKLREGK